MVYRFDEDGHGMVVAEARQEQLDPYLGLHYPASDIPRQARLLYLRNWLRIIPDARYTPAAILPANRPDAGTPLDLSLSVLRSVSPIHLEYLANLGVRASMSISLSVRERLWGLISCCNHSGALHVPFALRSACEVLGRLTSLQIAALEEQAAGMARSARRPTHARLALAMRDGGSGEVLKCLIEQPAELLELVDAGGAAAVDQEGTSTCGRTPDAALLRASVAWLDANVEDAVFATDALSRHLPEAAAAKDVAAGLLSFVLPGEPRRRLLWFRPEVISTVPWGGNPNKPVEPKPQAGQRLHPRRSFELWKEEVRLRSRGWSASDLEAAEELRRAAVEVDLVRQLEREQRAVRARDDLVAVVSHDLKNPLGVIQMQAALLLRTAVASDQEPVRRLRGSAERIQRAVDRMNALISDLLDLAKIEAGRFEVQPQPERAEDIVDDVTTIMGPLAESKQIRLITELRSPSQVNVDRERVFQVLSNLVGNALKFTPEGGTITLKAEPAGREVLFSVADTGSGIPQEQLPHVFDRYWQAPRASRKGTGLGLYIAKGIVEAHGGQLWVQSVPARGATFGFTLPACPS
jgi:light-regulated signal transduction histidine kinase (bacteriophytochrome)